MMSKLISSKINTDKVSVDVLKKTKNIGRKIISFTQRLNCKPEKLL